jgi:2-polyprenyl-3-methyl-5-hydroxy-6-metoxy-1,4-benzoquinol methylase
MAGHRAKNTDERILFVPAVGEGAGIGHIRRCAALVKQARGPACLLLAAGHTLPDWLLNGKQREYIVGSMPSDSRFKLVVMDNRQTPLSVLSAYTAAAPVIGLDEGGRFRDRFPYLIDTLPGPRGRCEANLVFPFWPETSAGPRTEMRYPFKRVLLSFGGEDRQGLTQILLGVLLRHGIFSPPDISVVQGPLFENKRWPPGVRVYDRISNLGRVIKEHDLLFTHFGLTCYEALACGIPIIIFNPSVYHRNLTLQAGFPEIGVGNPRMKRLNGLLKNEQVFRHLLAQTRPSAQTPARSLAEYLNSGVLTGSYACPLCKQPPRRSLARFADKSFFRCSRCGMIHALHFGGEQVYDRDYFFTRYHDQYGRTYLEDFASIQKTGERRLEIIMGLLQNKKNVRLLDIGCAYGPFLKAALLRGLHVQGMDISEEAVDYVKKTLGIACARADFQNPATAFMEKNKNSFDVVSMWYVIEHFREPHKVLQNINLLLKPGGILAFSSPSAAGISAKKNLRLFLQASPSDHYTVWIPARVKKQLAALGFTVKKVKITGHHAERLFKAGKFPGRRGKVRGLLFAAVSRLLKLGDTFEVYAVKIGDAR